MQAMKFIFKRAALLSLAGIALFLSACGEKTPEQIAAENRKKADIAIRRAQVLLFDEKNDDAISILEKAYEECGASPELCEQLAYAYSQQGNFPMAAMYFEKASDMKDGDAELLINAARSYERSSVTDSAAKAYEKYLKIKPQDGMAWKSLSQAYMKQEKFQEALNALMASVKADGRNPDTMEAAAIGNLFLKLRNTVQARRWLEAAREASLPENVEVRKEIYLGLVTVYLAEKETALLEKAVAELDKIDPNLVKEKYPELHRQLAEFRQHLKDAEDAIKADELKKAEELRKAEEEKKLAEQKAEEEKKAAEEAAKTKEAEGDSAKAEGEAKTDGADAEGGEESGDKPMSGENLQVPLKDVEPTAEEQMSPYDKFLKMSAEYLEKGENKMAERSAHLAIAEDKNAPQAWRALAKAYEAQQKDNDAYLAAREAFVRDADDINNVLYYIRTASRVQNSENFLNTLYRAHEKFPNNPEIMLGLARTYRLLGDHRNAKFFYNSFINGTPKEYHLYQEVYDEFEEMLAEPQNK